MAKNNVKTIINTLNSKLRKNDITNSDRKEIKQVNCYPGKNKPAWIAIRFLP